MYYAIYDKRDRFRCATNDLKSALLLRDNIASQCGYAYIERETEASCVSMGQDVYIPKRSSQCQNN